MLPHLERGLTYSGAVQAANYRHHSDFCSDFCNDKAYQALPYYGQALPRDAIGAYPKMERFEQDQDFLARQLNETRYLSRTARTYLACLYNEKGEARQRVRVIPGRMTALLRRSWGPSVKCYISSGPSRAGLFGCVPTCWSAAVSV